LDAPHRRLAHVDKGVHPLPVVVNRQADVPLDRQFELLLGKVPLRPSVGPPLRVRRPQRESPSAL
jgi:hypothetical protein